MMTHHLNPDIGTATDQTVINLKEVESRLVSLKNDLAWLCQGLGNVEAARIAASPVQPSLPGFTAFPGASAHVAYGNAPFGGFQANPLGPGNLATVPIATPTSIVSVPVAYGNPAGFVPLGPPTGAFAGYNPYSGTPIAAMPWGLAGALPFIGPQAFAPMTPIQVAGLR